ncbi:glycosyltransferase [Litoribrevibacter albus]|uniref:Glycosyl transferase family 1 domain-containing protein n=1 Tax=Litoribrevibacter albus TaxID=1473156 RepID=A0AA37W7W8_9GAMM|nr:glycosyltransferase [Litoribrevibacter albus]GLQ33205.1 hypothetical protein GCM10007876_36850 [Litoribrevibacter albus]
MSEIEKSILFVNVGPSYSKNFKYYTSAKFWDFFSCAVSDVETVGYIGPFSENTPKNLALFPVSGCRTYKLPFFSSQREFYWKYITSLFFRNELNVVLSELAKFNFDVVYLRDFGLFPYLVVKRLVKNNPDIRVVLHITSDTKKLAESNFKGIKKHVYRFYSMFRFNFEYKFLTKFDHKVLLNSPHPYFNFNDNCHLMMAHSSKGFKSREEAYACVNRTFEVDAPYILFVGRISKEKGVGILIDSFLGSKDLKNKFKLLIAGDGPELAAIKKNYECSEIVFLGNVSNQGILDNLYSASSCVVIPSLEDGVPKVLMESLSCGAVTLASRVGFIDKILDSRYIFEPGNVNQLTELIEAVLVGDESNKVKDWFLLESERFSSEALQARVKKFIFSD